MSKISITPNNISRRAALLGIYNTFVMSDHFLSSPNLLLDFAKLTLGLRRAFGKNSKLDWGEPLLGMITTLLRGHPEQHLHTAAHAHHTTLRKQALLRRGLGFRGVGEPLPRTAGIFVFDVRKMLRFRFRNV